MNANNFFCFIILFVVTTTYYSNGSAQVANQKTSVNRPQSIIKIKERVSSEASAFDRRYIVPFTSNSIKAKERTLGAREERRAYEGAPPKIPHSTIETNIKPLGAECTSCHENGGYVRDYEAFAPVTPHPNWSNCRQCHVPVQTDGLFRSNNFVGLVQREIDAKGQTAFLPGGPPQIPHSVELRGDCLSCHSGAAAVTRIRTSHPDRTNCRQCHVPTVINTYVWRRDAK